MIPRPIYRALPYLYLLAGALSAAWLRPPYGYFPALMFAAAGLSVLVLRYKPLLRAAREHSGVRYRKRKKNPKPVSPPEPAAEEQPTGERRTGTERRTNTTPETFPLRDRNNGVIPVDRRKRVVRRRGI